MELRGRCSRSSADRPTTGRARSASAMVLGACSTSARSICHCVPQDSVGVRWLNVLAVHRSECTLLERSRPHDFHARPLLLLVQVKVPLRRRQHLLRADVEEELHAPPQDSVGVRRLRIIRVDPHALVEPRPHCRSLQQQLSRFRRSVWILRTGPCQIQAVGSNQSKDHSRVASAAG